MGREQKLTVFYDGLCRLCSREIAHYQRQKGAEEIRFVDICAPGFSAEREGVDPFEVHRVMHVRRPVGTLATRVQAFLEIWERLPRYRGLARLARWRAIRPALELGYSLFAWIRPNLPRRKRALDCAESPYCEVKNA